MLTLRTGREPLDSSGSHHPAAGPRAQWANMAGLRRLTYAQGVALFRDTDHLSESDKAALMGLTLQKIYKW
jgi:hypothetical protein